MEYIHNEALELASNALSFTDDAILKFTSRPALPEPLDCKTGCHYCCFNLPQVTPPEALLIGHHVEKSFSDRKKQDLIDRIKKILELIEDKQPAEIAMMRHELPCIFLKEGLCMVYPVRPVVCRTCSSISAEHCRAIFESRNHRASLRCYHHIREIFHTVQKNLVDKCRELGLQADPLYVAEGLRDYFKHPSPVKSWLQGEIVFHVPFR